MDFINRKILRQLKTSGTTQPASSALIEGEIALSTDVLSPKMFLKKNNGEIATFRDRTYFDNAAHRKVEKDSLEFGPGFGFEEHRLDVTYASTYDIEDLFSEVAAVKFVTKQKNSAIALNLISTNQTLEYSMDHGNTWRELTISTRIKLQNYGDSVYVRGVLSNDNTQSNYTQFAMAGNIKASGNINYLWDKDNPDTALKNCCGYNLFSGCTALSDVSELELPATTLAYGCYWHMFYNCTSLTTAPELPATILADECYASMFYGCTSLTTAPVLPAITLAKSCYAHLFHRCTSLTEAPELPATALTYNCYSDMFEDCTSLTKAPTILPATALTENCYAGMFRSCTSLTTAPVLPATTLAYMCYAYMFQYCTSLTTAPVLSALTLANECYYYMFNGCRSLTAAPILPATTLANYCYNKMFYGCTNLNYIKCLATDISATECTTDWVYNVVQTGTFVKNASMNDWTTGVNGIPEGWVVEDDQVPAVKFTAKQANSTVGLNNLSTGQTLEYSTDGNTWNSMTTGTTITLTNSGDSVYVRGVLSDNNTYSNYTRFKMSGNIKASGNINYLWNKNSPDAELKKYCGCHLFSGCTALSDASELELPATTLEDNCYNEMFYHCTSLTTAPELPATTLVYACYSGMFINCTSLTTAPELPATTLEKNCYKQMFQGCYNLNYIKCLATDISSTDCTYNWVDGVVSTGTFVKDSLASDWTTGVNGIPEGWAVEDAS